MNNARIISKNGSKYNSARISLLLISIISVINLFSILFTETYYVFSAYFTQILGGTGYYLYLETGEVVYPIVTSIIGIISVVPYFLCWLFSKKRFGWMVAGLILFCVDSVGFLFDLISLLSIGQFSMTIDLVIRVLIIVELGVAVKCGKAYFEELKASQAVPEASRPVYDQNGNIVAFAVTEGDVPSGLTENATQTQPEVAVVESQETTVENQEKTSEGEEKTEEVASETAQETTQVEQAETPKTRKLVLNRKKTFVACAVSITVCVNNQEIVKIKNGQSVTLEVPTTAFALGTYFTTGVGVGNVNVEPGVEDIEYEAVPKMGFVTNEIVLNKIK